MTDNELLSSVKDSIREELNREANETIDKLCHKFRCELGKHKSKLVAEILDRVHIEVRKVVSTQDVYLLVKIDGGLCGDR